AQLAGLPAPARTDGVSLLPVLTGERDQHAGEVYIEYVNNTQTPGYQEFHASHRGQQRGQMQVIYLDGYKGVRYHIESADDTFLIYDTREDPGETTNLAGSGDQFQTLQQRMKDRVLRVRRPDTSAARPYDEAPVPSLDAVENLEPGLRYDVFEAAAPWVPDVSTLPDSVDRQSGIVEGFDLN